MDNVVFIPYQVKEDLVYSLNAGDVHWCVNAKGIRGVSCPSKAYGIMAAGKPMIGVLEEGTEIRRLIEEIGCGKVCEPGYYMEVANIIRWYINNLDCSIAEDMGMNGRKFLEKKFTRAVSVERYSAELLQL